MFSDGAEEAEKWAMRDPNTLLKPRENGGLSVAGCRNGGHAGPGAVAGGGGAEELLACWARLDDRRRAELLAVARGLAGATAG